jgi:fatty-acyl-CoA synthase
MSAYTVANLLRKNRSARAVNPQRRAVVFGDRVITYDELDLRTDRLASALAARGFVAGDRVAVLLLNRPEHLEVFFAVAKLGGVVVPVNYLFKAAEVEHLLRDSGARWAFVEERLWTAVRPLRAGRVDVTFVSLDATEPGTTAYEELLAAGSAAGVDVVVDADAPFVLQYTSGTTGFPKGATHTHGTVLWNALQQLADFGLSEDDVYLCIPALCWAAGMHSFTLSVLWAGGTVVLHPSRGFDPGEVCRTVERHGVTIMVLVPSVLRMVLGHPLEEHELGSLRLAVSGGEPVPVPAIEELQRRLPTCDLVQGYGMTEFPTVMTFLAAAHAVAKRGSAGRAGTTTELRVLDDDGRDAEAGVHGEIVVRSPATMVGYHGRPDATAAAIVEGWFHTGDRGYLDDDGFLYIAGRSKDLIISGGLNVYPAEVERVLETHPAVREVAVVGAPDDRYGEVGVAHVVLEDGVGAPVVAQGELEALARAELADFKVPRRFVLRQEPLPRTASGKVQKFELREPLAE